MQRSFHTTNIRHHVVAKCRLAAMLDFPHVENQPAGAILFSTKSRFRNSINNSQLSFWGPGTPTCVHEYME